MRRLRIGPSTAIDLLLNAIAKRGQTERESSPTILLARIPTGNGRSPLSRYADFQMGLSRAAYIVASAHHYCATRPFAKTQSVPPSATAPAAITRQLPCRLQPVRPNQCDLTRQGSPCNRIGRHRPLGNVGRSRECAREGQIVCATCALATHEGELDSQFARTWPLRSEGGHVRIAIKSTIAPIVYWTDPASKILSK
jgi:hypothetical protein